MPTVATQVFSGSRLDAAFRPDLAVEISRPLAPGTYAKGQVLGQITGTNTADVQTITVAACTHSTMTLYNLPGGKYYAAAQDISTATLQAALRTLIGDATGVVVTGTYSAGSGGTYILTYGNTFANQPITLAGVTATFVGGSSPTIAIAHTTLGIGPATAYGAYATGHSDGTQYPVAFLAYPCTVDNGGVITMIGTTGQTYMAAPMFIGGYFKCEDLVGLDAGGLAAIFGTVVSGTLTTGIVKI